METISKRTAAEWIGGLWMKTAGQLRLRCFVETSFLAQATVELKRGVERFRGGSLRFWLPMIPLAFLSGMLYLFHRAMRFARSRSMDF